MYDSDSSNAEVLAEVLKKMRTGARIAPSEFRDFVKAQNDGATSLLAHRYFGAQRKITDCCMRLLYGVGAANYKQNRTR